MDSRKGQSPDPQRLAKDNRVVTDPHSGIDRGGGSRYNCRQQKKSRSDEQDFLVEASGLEPPTPTLSGWCSNLLSYASIWLSVRTTLEYIVVL